MNHLKSIPRVLPHSEPYYYLSSKQAPVCAQYPILKKYIPVLPCWIPHRTIADALGFSHEGIDNACHRYSRPYLWATEFENVHSLWNYEEPHFQINGIHYKGSEDYYQRQKPFPFCAETWDARRDHVMRIAISSKFNADHQLKQLLLSTQDHPLVSIKRDNYWGIFADGTGENKLALMLMELRTILRARH